MKRMMISMIFLSFLLSATLAMATDVGGLIDTDTTWDLAGSPYIVVGNTLVSSGVSLTIEPGVEVRFNGFYYLRVEGNLQAKGTFDNKILFTSNLSPQQKRDWYGIAIINNIGSELSWAVLEYVSYAAIVGEGSGNKINNCTVRYCYVGGLFGSDNLMVNNNYFYDCDAGALIQYGDSIYFMNNTLEIMGTGIEIGGFSNLSINYNNFLDVQNYIVDLHGNTTGIVDARYNYWGPLTTAEMDSEGSASNIEKILDFYDDPTQGKVNYDNWLSELNPEAYPNPSATPPNFLPVANAGADKVVFDTAMLDGRSSSDPDGEVVSYEWTLVHRENPAYDRTASGMTPTVPTLNPGFYDVILTVTDNDGLVDTDTMLLAAAGQCATIPVDRMPPTGSIHAYPNMIWPPNNKNVTVTLKGYVKDELSIARDGGGVGVSSAYLLVDGNTTIPIVLDTNGRFSVTVEIKAEKGVVYKVELHATDTNSVGTGGPNSGLVDSTFIRVDK